MVDQVEAFNRGKAELGLSGEHLTLSLSRVGFIAKNEADKRKKVALADDYYSRFDNVFTGPGIVEIRGPDAARALRRPDIRCANPCS